MTRQNNKQFAAFPFYDARRGAMQMPAVFEKGGYAGMLTDAFTTAKIKQQQFRIVVIFYRGRM